MARMKRLTKRLPRSTSLLLAAALLLAVDLPLEAQKPTIQRSGGAFGGASGGGRLRSLGSPRSGVRGGRVSASRGPSTGAPTLSPGFPLRGRGEPPAVFGTAPSSAGRTSPGLQSGRPAGTVDHDKRFLRSLDRRDFRDFDRDRSSRDHRRRRHHDRDVTFIVFDPFFYDPFLRYHRFDRFRYFSGFGCGFYDRHFPGFYFRHSFDPCFSSFGVALGWPWVADPWPGFWSSGFYPYWSGYGYGGYGGGYTGGGYTGGGYTEGYDEGYARGYASGQVRGAQEPAAAYGLAPETSYDEGYGGPTGAGAGSYALGRNAMAEGRYEAALAAFDDHLATHRGDAGAHLARGVALTALGHYGKAADAFRRGVDALAPGQRPDLDAPALFASRAEFRRVLDNLEAYVRTHADSRTARFDLGMIYLMSGEREAAGALFRSLPHDTHAKLLDATLRVY